MAAELPQTSGPIRYQRVMKVCALLVISWVLALGVPLSAMADEVLPPPPVHTPEEQLEIFRFAVPGYRVELVAQEPMVQDPVAIRFDGEGRLWVAEMRGYMQDIERTGVHDPNGRVSVLTDTDGDGSMDESTVFAEGLVLPRAILVYPDGVLIAERKALHFFEDTDGDDVADRKTLVDPDYARDSVEHSANGLLRAMDNWIYNAKEGHRYRRDGDKWIRDETEARGQWGLSQDNRGRIFYNYNHSQLFTDLAPPNTLTRNEYHDPSTGLNTGVTLTNAVFPIRPTPAANRGYIPGALDEGGRIKEFTSACSPLIYREGLFPEFAGNAFVCEPVGNLIKRNMVTDLGYMVTASPAYPDRDFLASTDERFRPVDLQAGPDGAIYIVDMYRGIVQDGPHMSPYLREHTIAREMDAPVHMGRIWRLLPENAEPSEAPLFGEFSTEELVDLLSHESGWWRDQAQMHIVDRGLRETIPALTEMALQHESALARLHALWALEGLGDVEAQGLSEALADQVPMVQSAALRVLANLGMSTDAMLSELAELRDRTPSEEVILQMILTLGGLNQETAAQSLLWELAQPRLHDPLMRDALMSSLDGQEVRFLEQIWTELPADPSARPGLPFFLESLSLAVTSSRKASRLEILLTMSEQGGWAGESLLQGMRLQGPQLVEEPVKLSAAPGLVAQHPELASWFAWPGHQPEPPPMTDVLPLTSKEQERFTRGRQVFLTSCAACHGADGKGMKLLAPPLAGSDWVLGSEERLVRVLFHGLSGPITVSGKRYEAPEIQPVMPPLATLSNADIAAVLTYIRREWGNDADPISPNEVNQHRIKAQGRTVPWTESELEPFAHPSVLAEEL